MSQVPYRADLSEAPGDAVPIWRTASDGVRLRLAYWPGAGSNGTVLLFPGRTEHIEKYGRVVRDLAENGYATITIDWRGQGFSDRLLGDPSLGHVGDFPDYQRDVAEMIAAAREAGLPQPWYLLAHSMGGSIGLRALVEGLPVRRAVFSAPLWGIRLPIAMRPLPFVLPPIYRLVGKHETYTPGTRPANYAAATGFDRNLLTTDPRAYRDYTRHAIAEPAFAMGGPSVHWVGRAAVEGRALARMPRPALPVLTFLGEDEAVVSTTAIHNLHAEWPSASLRVIPGAKHELMMEAAPGRDLFFRETIEFFQAP